MKAIIIFLSAIVILQACVAQTAISSEPIVLKGICNQDCYYELNHNRVYLNKEYDSILGFVFTSNEVNSLEKISNFCSKPCGNDKETRIYLAKSHCGFDGNFATIDLVEESTDLTTAGIKSYKVRFFCCGSSGRRYPVYLLSFKTEKDGKRRAVNFEYAYDEL